MPAMSDEPVSKTPATKDSVLDLPVDHSGMRVLPYDDCLRRLASRPVGRVAFVSDGEIEVLPVNFVLYGTSIAFRTTGGSKLGAAIEQAKVTFQVDDWDGGEHDGWSVMVKGWAEAVSDLAKLDKLDAFGLKPWASAVVRPIWVELHTHEVTGRTIGPANPAPPR